MTDKCTLQPDTGPCRASIPSYYYNTASGNCEKFIYGGCDGNENRFETAAQCVANCSNNCKWAKCLIHNSTNLIIIFTFIMLLIKLIDGITVLVPWLIAYHLIFSILPSQRTSIWILPKVSGNMWQSFSALSTGLYWCWLCVSSWSTGWHCGKEMCSS